MDNLESVQDSVGQDIPTLRHFGRQWAYLYQLGNKPQINLELSLFLNKKNHLIKHGTFKIPEHTAYKNTSIDCWQEQNNRCIFCKVFASPPPAFPHSLKKKWR